jgi:carbon-monoxide dehydrogenase large subunit
MYIGSPIRRKEDHRFLTGRGNFVDDIVLPNAAYATFVRSPHAHALIGTINCTRARMMPGVLLVLTGRDWEEAGLGKSPVLWTVTSRDGQPMLEAPRPILTADRCRHVGDTIALVIADTRAQAQDAAEAVEVDYQPLAAVVNAPKALEKVAPVVHEHFGTNLAYDWEMGREDEVLREMGNASHVTSLNIVNQRIAPCPLEPRAVAGQYDAATDQYTLWSTTQNPHMVRRWLSENSLFIAEHKLRVVAPDVGGGFGQKIYHYPEEATVLWASKIVGRPVRWTSSRLENLIVDIHARDHVTKCSMGFDRNGKYLALHVDTVANLGAYMSPFGSCIPTYFYAPMLSEIYKIPHIYCRVRGAYTHTTPVDAYRGAGRPEALFVVERLIENGAYELGVEPSEFRLRNLIQSNEFPYTTATGVTYDSGDYPALVKNTKRMANYDALRAEQQRLRGEGILMGIGMSGFIDCAGAGPSKLIAKLGARVGFWDVVSVRVHPSGKVTVFCGSHSHGQGHATTFSQVVADRMNCDINDVEIVEGDTDRIPYGMGTYASRSMSVIGAAMATAVDRIVKKGGKLASHLLECSDEDLEFVHGKYTVKGSDRSISFKEIVKATYQGADYPMGFELGLEETVFHDPEDYNWPSAFHICTVLVDPETGKVKLRDYYVTDDVGCIINPMIVEGQIAGGLAQGIGQALLEQCVFDPSSGQLLTATFMDYAMPRADDLPSFHLETQETPNPNHPLGVKGAGESGTIGAPSAVANAVVDALRPLGVTHVDMPLTPFRVWEAIQAARCSQV